VPLPEPEDVTVHQVSSLEAVQLLLEVTEKVVVPASDKTDYVKVIDNKQGESHAIILQVLANEVNLYQSHRSPAFDTKIRTFLINVFHVSTRSHYTGWDRTMYQSKSMTQFMDHFFFETV